MCDSISMPDGRELYEIDDSGDCLCCKSDEDVRKFIAKTVPVEKGEVLIIERNDFGWDVSLRKTEELEQTPILNDIEKALTLLDNIEHLCISTDDNYDFKCLKQQLVTIEVREILKMR